MNNTLKHQNISIIGCGWLGLPLAKKLIENGVNLKGSTTSTAKLQLLENEGIHPFLIQLTEKTISGNIKEFLSESTTLIINIPPGLRRNPEKKHVAEIKKLIEAVEKSNIKTILYVSSISVYKDEVLFPEITEDNQPNTTSNSGKQLIEIENLLQSNPNFETTVLRFAGLIDSERHPGKVLSGREDVSNPNAPINLIHKNDCIGIVLKLIEDQIWDVTLNAAFPFHPTKKDYYSNYCKTNNLELPEFSKTISKGKIINGSRLAQLLEYEYKTCP